MEYTTNLKIKEVVDILVEQIDPIPSNLWTRLRKTTPICGRVDNQGFELRNNTYHMYSLRAYGKFHEDNSLTKIEINFGKPSWFFNIYGNLLFRYNADRKVILSFLKQWIELEENQTIKNN
jgi:hypothetical protein